MNTNCCGKCQTALMVFNQLFCDKKTCPCHSQKPVEDSFSDVFNDPERLKSLLSGAAQQANIDQQKLVEQAKNVGAVPKKLLET